MVREDDWDGFGQRLTGSGTTRFTGARVETEHVYDFAQRFRYQTAFYQHVLLATLAGIGLAVERDAAQGVKHRSRMYSHGNAAVPRDDAQVLQVVGQISSWAWATRAAGPAGRGIAAAGLCGARQRRRSIDCGVTSWRKWKRRRRR